MLILPQQKNSEATRRFEHGCTCIEKIQNKEEFFYKFLAQSSTFECYTSHFVTGDITSSQLMFDYTAALFISYKFLYFLGDFPIYNR